GESCGGEPETGDSIRRNTEPLDNHRIQLAMCIFAWFFAAILTAARALIQIANARVCGCTS
ncbi:MAG: hypothetical protein ACRD3Q_17185, partial [Terriglobales bacterium]